MAADLTRGALRARFAADHPDVAGHLDDALTLVQEVPTTFLRRYTLASIMPRRASRPLLFYVAVADGLPAHLITTDPETLTAVLRDEGTMLDGPDEAAGFVEVLVETTRRKRGLTRLVASTDDIPFAEALSADELQAARAGLAGEVTAPVAEPADEGWRVTAFVVRDGSLRREVFTVGRDGSVEGPHVEAAEDLPLITVV